MSEAKTRKFCKQCQSNVLAVRPVPNHILHFLITIFTCGLWVIPWALMSFDLLNPALSVSLLSFVPDCKTGESEFHAL